jgi:hypothetical protein
LIRAVLVDENIDVFFVTSSVLLELTFQKKIAIGKKYCSASIGFFKL